MTFEQEEVVKFLERREKYLQWEKRNRHIKIMANIGMIYFGALMALIVIDFLTKVE
jgi:hypothetical protein